MDFDKVLSDIANSMGIPLYLLNHNGKADTFITYNVLSEQGQCYADDQPGADEVYISLDLFTKSNLRVTKKTLKRKLREAGFIIQPSGAEFLEEDTGYYHTVIEVCATQGVEGD